MASVPQTPRCPGSRKARARIAACVLIGFTVLSARAAGALEIWNLCGSTGTFMLYEEDSISVLGEPLETQSIPDGSSARFLVYGFTLPKLRVAWLFKDSYGTVVNTIYGKNELYVSSWEEKPSSSIEKHPASLNLNRGAMRNISRNQVLAFCEKPPY